VWRFMDRVKILPYSSCWEWDGSRNNAGYGQLRINFGKNGYNVLAHRVSYAIFYGGISNDMCLDHLCRNPACVNPWHLEMVTIRENGLRGIGPAATNSMKTHCKHGHEFTPENTRIRRGTRECMTCARCWADKNRDSYNAQRRAKRAARRINAAS
jgi:hypothetical protein